MATKKTPKTVINKAVKIQNLMSDLYHNLLFEGLPMENKKDFYKAMDEMKVFIDNL